MMYIDEELQELFVNSSLNRIKHLQKEQTKCKFCTESFQIFCYSLKVNLCMVPNNPYNVKTVSFNVKHTD